MLEVVHLVLSAEQLKQVYIINAQLLHRRRQTLCARGRAGLRIAGEVFGVERALVRGYREHKVRAQALDVLLHEGEVVRGGVYPALAERIDAGPALDLGRVVEPAVAAEYDVVLGAVPQGREQLCPAGDKLLPEIKAVVDVVGQLAEVVGVQRAVALRQVGHGRAYLVCPGRGGAVYKQTDAGYQAEREYQGYEYKIEPLHRYYAP